MASLLVLDETGRQSGQPLKYVTSVNPSIYALPAKHTLSWEHSFMNLESEVELKDALYTIGKAKILVIRVESSLLVRIESADVDDLNKAIEYTIKLMGGTVLTVDPANLTPDPPVRGVAYNFRRLRAFINTTARKLRRP